MRFGIEFGSYPADLDPAEVCEQVTLGAEVAHKNNFEGLFVAQHYLTGPDAAILAGLPDRSRPVVTSSACSRCT